MLDMDPRARDANEDTGVFTVEEFRRAPDPIIERSLQGRRVVIESAPGQISMVLSVGSSADLERGDE